jgi:hypothetical protein
MPSEAFQPRILLVASGTTGIALRALQALEARFPDHRIDIVASETLVPRLSIDERSRVVFVVGQRSARVSFLQTARREQYWLVAVLLAGQPGYFTMKLAGLLIGLGRVVIYYNENGGAFVLDRRYMRIVMGHLVNRLSAGRGLVVQRTLLRVLYSVVGEPIGLCRMVASIALGRLHCLLRNTAVSVARPE